MKKRMNLSIDADVYDALGDLPRKVSISEVVSWLLKIMVEEFKKGRELTDEELIALVDGTPEGRDFRERLNENWGPGVKRLLGLSEKVMQVINSKKSKLGKGKK